MRQPPPRVRPVPALVPRPPQTSLVKFVGNIYTLKCRYAALPWGREEAARPGLGLQSLWARLGCGWTQGRGSTQAAVPRSLGPLSFITCKTWVQLLALTHSLVTVSKSFLLHTSIIPPIKRD